MSNFKNRGLQRKKIGFRRYIKDEDNIKKEYVLQRRNVKPGITGYSQINYSGKKRSLNEKIKLDLYYIENLNILIYFKIIFLTPVTLIKRFIFNRKGSTL